MSKDNNKETRTTPVASFWCLYCYLWTYSTSCSSVSIVNFENVIASWEKRAISQADWKSLSDCICVTVSHTNNLKYPKASSTLWQQRWLCFISIAPHLPHPYEAATLWSLLDYLSEISGYFAKQTLLTSKFSGSNWSP